MDTQQGAPSRPWFRLATMARPPQPPTQQLDQAPPPPRPPLIRPTFSQVPPPPTNVVAPTSAPVVTRATPSPTVRKEPASPIISRVTSSPPARTTFIRPTFIQVPPPPNVVAPTLPPVLAKATPSPMVRKELASPTITRVTSSPPSPLLLPSPQLLNTEYEQKTMLMQETKERPKGFDNGRQIKREALKKKPDSDDVRMRIITISGENKGAIMDLTPFSNKNHKSAGNIKKDDPATSSSDGDDKSGEENSKAKKKASHTPLMTAIMNSNVQGVNNSILYNCSTSHHDPGVHLSFSRKPNGYNSGTK